MTPAESVADPAEGMALPFRPQKLTVRQLLASHVAVLDELLRRGIVRTRNSPLGDLAETIALRAYGGTLAPNSEKSYDLATPYGRRIHVKARLVGPADRRSQNFSAFRSFDFVVALFLLFDATSYDLIWARELTSEATRDRSTSRAHQLVRHRRPECRRSRSRRQHDRSIGIRQHR